MSTPWICRQCLVRLGRQTGTKRPKQIRFASTTSATYSGDNPTVSPFLLSRARSSAEEHATLTSKLADSYDTSTAKRLGELTPVTDALNSYNDAMSSLKELHSLLQDPTSDAELRTLASEDLPTTESSLATATHALTTALIPRHPFAHLPCLLEIRPGVGGNEAALFAADLLRMYTAYCSANNLRTTLLKYEASDGMADPNGSDAPMSEAILEIASPGAYGSLRGEAGVHRVQRVPATETKGRTHTSAASVLVLPSFTESGNGEDETDFDNPNSDYYIHPSDVKTDVMRARGAGGQHVNTTDSAVRLTHTPTGTVVAMQDARSQLKNRTKAWGVLRAKIAQMKRDAREEEMLALRRRSVGGQGKANRSDKVRTYNWGQQRVTDHRSGVSVMGELQGVIEGGEALEGVMESVRRWLVERDVEDLAAEEEVRREGRK